MEYSNAYYMACILMIPVTVPLIQNVGLSILQAKNKYKYRTMIFFAIAIANIGISIPLAKQFGGIGSAIGTSLALVIGQIIIMNIYYHKKIHINMIEFWKEIIKMSVSVLITFLLGFGAYRAINTENIIIYGLEIIIYTLVYATLMWNFAMNDYEKNIIRKPINKILHKGE